MVSCSVWIQHCCQSCVAVSSPVTCLHLSWWDLTVMQIITPCVATKLKVCYLLQILFFVTFDSLLAKNVFVILINCYFIVHVFGIFSFMEEHFYNQTGKTVNTRNISGMLLCCKIKASWAWETKLQARILISFCGFVASWRALIFAVIGRKYFKCSRCSRSHCKIWQRNCTITKKIKNNMFLMLSGRGTKKSGLVMILGFKKHIF